MLRIIWILIYAAAGVLFGCGAVFVFNRLPASWLCDYGEVPKEDLLQRQRINSTPWKGLFSCFFVAAGAYLAYIDPLYAAAGIVLFWFLILIAVADAKYMIVPDQLCFMVAICSLGFINYHHKPVEMFYGALIGGGVMLLVALAGKLISKKDVLGMGDVKLMGALGFALGNDGIIAVIIGSSVLSAMAFSLMILWKKTGLKDSKPLGPYIAAAAAIYILVIWPIQW